MAQQMQIGRDLPVTVMQQADMAQLGIPIASYKPLFASPLSIIAFVLIVCVLDFIVIAVAYALGYILYITVIIPFAAIIYGIYALFTHRVRVYQFTAGLVSIKGKEMDVLRWDQVEAVWQKITRSRYGTRYTYTVRRLDGKIFTFNNMLRKVSMLGQNMQNEVAKLHIPRAIDVFNTGQTLTFGKFGLNTYGITNGREQLPWPEVKDVLIKRGQVIVKKSDKMLNWSTEAVSNIPNFPVFLRVINYARGIQR